MHLVGHHIHPQIKIQPNFFKIRILEIHVWFFKINNFEENNNNRVKYLLIHSQSIWKRINLW